MTATGLRTGGSWVAIEGPGGSKSESNGNKDSRDWGLVIYHQSPRMPGSLGWCNQTALLLLIVFLSYSITLETVKGNVSSETGKKNGGISVEGSNIVL